MKKVKLTEKQRAALLSVYAGTIDYPTDEPDEPGFRASTFRALRKRNLLRFRDEEQGTHELTRAGRSALGLYRRQYKTTLGALRSAIKTLTPWPVPSAAVLTGRNMPSLYQDADDPFDPDADPIVLTAAPGLVAAVAVDDHTVEELSVGDVEYQGGEAESWAYAVGLDSEDGKIVLWEAVMAWMDELGHPVGIDERQGYMLVFKEED